VKALVYDAINGKLDRVGLTARRQRLTGGLDGDVLEIGAGTGLNLAHYRDAERIIALEPNAPGG